MFRIKFLLVFLIDYTSSYNYTFIQGPFTFQEGHERCKSMGMSPAIITDNSMQTDMQTEVENFLASASGGETNIWIGMVWNKTNSNFEWVDNEKIGPWTKWGGGEPNCMEGTTSEPVYCPADYEQNQNCVRIKFESNNWVWKTRGCDKTYPILCHSLSSSTTTFKPSTAYIPVECTMLGTFFINSTQVCSCQLLSNRSNLPEESWNFKIDKRSTNGYIRRHTSAYDGRLSSKIMGYTGIIIIGGVVLFVLLADLTTFLDKQKSYLPN